MLILRYMYKRRDLTKTWYDFADRNKATSTFATVERRGFTEPKLLHSWYWIYFKMQAWWLEDFYGCCNTSSKKTEQQLPDEGNWPWAHGHVFSLRLLFVLDKKMLCAEVTTDVLATDDHRGPKCIYCSKLGAQVHVADLLSKWSVKRCCTHSSSQAANQSLLCARSDPVSCSTSHMTLQHLGCCCSRKTFYWKFDVCAVHGKRKTQTPQDDVCLALQNLIFMFYFLFSVV